MDDYEVQFQKHMTALLHAIEDVALKMVTGLRAVSLKPGDQVIVLLSEDRWTRGVFVRWDGDHVIIKFAENAECRIQRRQVARPLC